MANTVNIYLSIEGQQVLALSIPSGDIERFSVRPVKWLRFVTFAICGVRGDLSMTPNGPPVDYDSIALDSIARDYYYTPEGAYNFIDHNAMNDRLTSSVKTPRSSNFRRMVMERDGRVCVFTGSVQTEAVHLLPKSKGDEYIAAVLQDRLNLYDPEEEPGDLVIDSIENGMLLSRNLHWSFSQGECAFLKTPNFALGPADIPRVEAGPIPSSRTTLHLWEPDKSFSPILQRDARISGTGISPPSTIALDFMYGVAAYQRWGSGDDIKKLMDEHFSNRYGSIPTSPASPQLGMTDSYPEHDDLNDGDNVPNTQSDTQPSRRNRAMDDVLALSMLLKGTTPELMATERRRREEEEELRAKEASQAKVVQWMQTCSSPTRLNSDIE